MRGLAGLFSLSVLLAPGPALAHAAERALVLLLPTTYYLAGAGAAVAVSFAVLCLAPWRGAAFRRRLRVPLPLPPLAGAARWAGFAAFAGLVACGFLGPRDPLHNLLPLVLWTLWWVGFAALTAGVGDLWPLLNPWSAPVGLLRRMGLRPVLRLPRAAGYWPALAGLAGFGWFEIVSLAPADPAGLARAALLYWLAHLAAMLLFGERRWRARGETFSVFFRLLGRLAPLHWGGRSVTVGLPGARLAHGPPLPLPGWLFVAALVANVSFDGLSATFAWLGLLGINPLDFPGRSAVMARNTAGLAAAWVTLALACAAAVAAGRRLAGSSVPPSTVLGRIGLALVPIALAYHLAHSLTVLMIHAQDAWAVVSDALGLAPVHVTTSFLNDIEGVQAIWRAQTALITGGHVLSVIVAHAIALDLERDRRRAALSQVPLALLMVGLTVLGLWLLSAPTGA